MTHDTETGSWDEYQDVPTLTDVRRRSINATAHAPQSLSVDQSDKRDQSTNKTLPWVCALVFSMGGIMTWMTWTAAKAQSSSDAANQRITDMIAMNGQVQSAHEQTLNDIRNRAIDAEVQAQLLREHYDKIANDFAARGLKFPPLPKELKSAK